MIRVPAYQGQASTHPTGTCKVCFPRHFHSSTILCENNIDGFMFPSAQTLNAPQSNFIQLGAGGGSINIVNNQIPKPSTQNQSSISSHSPCLMHVYRQNPYQLLRTYPLSFIGSSQQILVRETPLVSALHTISCTSTGCPTDANISSHPSQAQMPFRCSFTSSQAPAR
jgi:hypothetical protein